MKKTSKKAFSLVELIIVVVIIGVLSGVAYIGIQKAKSKTMNDKVLDDIIGIANALERYSQDHFGEYPIPKTTEEDADANMNVSCFYADATYAHDCENAAFRQGMIDNNLLTKRYMSEVPTDPRTGSRYVYGVSNDGQYFMVAGIYEESDGNFIAKTSGNLKKGYHLPSLIRAFNGPNFVVDNGENLPYSPDYLIITATLQNITDAGSVHVTDSNGADIGAINPGQTVYTGYTIDSGISSLDIYYSDGSISSLTPGSQLEILTGTEVQENDADNIVTKIRLKLFSGKVWNKVARLAKESEFNIETTTAIAGVRGTEFGVDATPGNEQVLLKSGKICRLNITADPTVINVDEIKNCTGSHAIAGLDASVDPVMIAMDADAAASGNTPSGDLKTLMEEQSKHYLNDNIAPHIKSVEGLTITVANLRTYYDLPEGVNLETNGIAVRDYNGNDLTSSLHLDSALLASTDDYELTITDSVYSNPITLHYVGLGGPDSGDSIPITVTTETSLSEEALYAAEEDESVVNEGDAIDCSSMVIEGDVTYTEGTASDTKDATLVWSVTPPECFIGATYDVIFDSLSPSTGSDAYLAKSGLTNGSAHSWSVTATTTDYGSARYPATDEATFTVPAGDTWCGDDEWQSENGEQCDNSDSTSGCIMIGADQCKCNEDLGWYEKPTPDGNCFCDTSGAAITLPDYTASIPINSSLTWEVSPVCAFEGANFEVYIGLSGSLPSTPNTTATGTLISLTDSSVSSLLTVGETYDWKIKYGTSASSGSFTVECPAVGDIINVNATVNADNKPEFSWNFDPACAFDGITTEISIKDSSSTPITDSPQTVAAGVTSFTWPNAITTDGTYTYSITSTPDPTDYSDSFTVAITPTNAFAVATPKTYYQTGEDIVFDITGYTSVDVTGGDWDTINNTFTASEAGAFTLTPVDGTTPDTANAVTITVCGYSGTSGDECWVLGEAGDSCTDACDEITGLSCEAGYDSSGNPDSAGTYGMWNDDSSCSICNQFGVDTSGGCTLGGTSGVNPLYRVSGVPEKACLYRDPDPIYTVDCSAVTAPTQRRICKCQ